MINYVYDLESFPNIFTMTVKQGGSIWQFEISHRRNDIDLIIQFLTYLRNNQGRMVGFNNLRYDYPLLHFVINNRASAELAYDKCAQLINSEDKFAHIIRDDNQYVPQLDLFKIHHFDNKAKRTSLKSLEFKMRSTTIQELPFPPGTWLTEPQMDILLKYNLHDVLETEKFLKFSENEIKFRESLNRRRWVNYNDVKIGTEYFREELEKTNPGCTRRFPDGTEQNHIPLSNVILPYIQFKTPQLRAIREQFKTAQNINICLGDFKLRLGEGGIHGSVKSQAIIGNIYDVDVVSYYPSIAIQNQFYPEHLGTIFCQVWADIKKRRLSFKKGTTENKALKFSLNGPFGQMGMEYGWLRDRKAFLSITINGQLLLCMLIDQIIDIPGLRLIQANTDGVTVQCPPDQLNRFRDICKWWQEFTLLELEEVQYTHMFIRDVNNYIAKYPDGKVKDKGEYLVKREWYKDHSALIIPKAVKAVLFDDADLELFIATHKDPWDFLLCTKVPRSSKLLLGDRQVQNVTRYYVSRNGAPLVKHMPPLAKNPGIWRKIGINVGYLATECNTFNGKLSNLNYLWYINEAKKLLAFTKGKKS